MTKTYSSRSNAKRAATKALGPDTQESIDYQLAETDDGWTWSGVRQPAPEQPAPEQPAVSEAPKPKHRAGTKQARLIEMLHRPEGASATEIAGALDWQAHTVRGAIAGTLKKKLGLTVSSEKEEARGRIYRIER